MTKRKQHVKANAYKKLRTLTTGMKVWTWESWITEPAQWTPEHPTYRCECRDRWGHPVNRDVFHVAARINRTWLIKIRVKCEADDGQIYFEETELEANDVKLDDFTDLYHHERDATVNACNPKHVKDVGWIAVTKN